MQNQKKFATAARNGLPRMAFLVNSLLGLDWIETMRTLIISLILAGSFMGAAWADTLQLQDKAPDHGFPACSASRFPASAMAA